MGCKCELLILLGLEEEENVGGQGDHAWLSRKPPCGRNSIVSRLGAAASDAEQDDAQQRES